MKPYQMYKSECEQIIQVCRRLYNRNMLAAADGNISLKVSDGILITPSGKAKAFIQPEDICLISKDNEILSGQPSSERLMHLAVYNHTDLAQAVVHAHPPTAIAWSVAYPNEKELPNECLSEIILAAGRIPIVPYARPGTEAMGSVLKEFIDQHKIMILSRHGGLCWGDTLEEATMGMERLEHSAEILHRARQLGPLTYLDDNEMQELYKIRQKIGNRTL
jgi:L-fuculose-phosphate aldolase